MNLKDFEQLIIIAKKHNVSSFTYEDVTINIEKEIPDFPSYPDVHDDEPPEPRNTDPLLNTQMMR